MHLLAGRTIVPILVRWPADGAMLWRSSPAFSNCVHVGSKRVREYVLSRVCVCTSIYRTILYCMIDIYIYIATPCALYVS